MTASRLDAEDLRRLWTWVAAIVQHLRPNAPMAEMPDGLRFGAKGSLAIALNGEWFDHEAGEGGRNAVSLIRHLQECSVPEAIAWARAWLEQHPGEGEFKPGDGAESGCAECGPRAPGSRGSG
jgi:hypothetical protein